ncbi:MAG TPA: STAS domain-containing protein [Thermoleophilaceae bacterium]|jgi:anti-anti-sigma factor
MLGDPLKIESKGDVVVVAVSGDVDLANAKSIGVQIAAAVPNESIGLVLDLAETTYLDSSGLHLIFDLAARLGERQQRLALSVPEASHLRRVLELVDVGVAAGLEPSVERAMAAVRA